jgi:hypothetical protein
LAAGSTDPTSADYLPKNADGGRIGLTSGTNTPITLLKGSYILCSKGILGKFAKQMDVTMDDGNTAAGSIQVKDDTSADPVAVATASISDATPYTVCMGF